LQESNSIQAESNLAHQSGAIYCHRAMYGSGWSDETSIQAWCFNVEADTGAGDLRLVYGLHLLPAKGRKGVTMDFAIILIVSNTLLAGFIYFVVTRIWQD